MNADDQARDAIRAIRRDENALSYERGHEFRYSEPTLALHAYQQALALHQADAPFSALIGAAYLRGDSANRRIIEAAFPLIAQQARRRYDAPGGVLPEEQDAA